MSCRGITPFCYSVVLALVIAWSCQAQVLASRTTLSGRVLDPNRAAVPGARIEAQAGELMSSARSDQDGEFSLPLAPGEYILLVEAHGFAEVSQIIDVKPASTNSLEIVLQVAASSATVTITDAAGYLTDSISSATRTLTPLRDTPQSITVVNKAQIKDQSLQSISDAVNYIPGISAHQGENNRDQLIMRGNSTSADFYVNGVRDDVQYYRDLYNVHQVEALKGPNAMIFGRGGGGGVINRVTKQAGFTPGREISFQVGSFGNRRVTTDIDQPITNKLAFRLNGLYENSDSFRRLVGLERYGINPTFTIVPSTRTSIVLGYEYFHDGRTADRGIPSFHASPVDVPIATYFGNPNDSRVRANVQLLRGGIDHQIGRLNILNRTQLGDYDKFYQNYVAGPVTADRSKASISAYNNATKRRNIFSQTDVSFALSSGPIRHTVLAGAELGRQLTDNFRNTGFFNNAATFVLVPLDNPIVSTPVTFRQSATDANNHLKLNLAATYAQDQIELSRQIQVITGVRFDYFDLSFHNNRNGDNLRRVDRLVSPRVGIVFKPVASVSIYGNYSVAYLPGSGDQFSSLTTITQQVKPEKFTSYEVGAKWNLLSSLALTTAVYRQDRTNTRAMDPNNPTAIVQTGSQRTSGFEVGLNGSVTRQWQIAGGYAKQNAFITSATTAAVRGAQVAQVPHNTFSLWNNYRILSRLGVGLGIIHRSDMFAAIDNTVTLPGYTRADAAVFLFFNEKWRLQANLQNLFDRKYYANADNNNNISPGSPRVLRIGLVARF